MVQWRLLYESNCHLSSISFKVNPVNTTGAGDAFGSGFLAGFINSNSNAKTALHLGMLNATAVIMHNGAQKGLLTKSELLKLKS